ncbi:MAG: head GIN domain-containing protein [Bacteroidota bacterium]
MNLVNRLLLFFGVLLFCPACVIDLDDDFNGDCVRGRGDLIAVDLNLADFSGIQLEIDAQVILRQGSSQSVTIEAEENIIDLIDLDVRNDIWEIDFEDCVRDYDNIRIFIEMPNISRLTVTGSGLIRGDNLFEVDEIDLIISGSGDIDLAVNADFIDGKISGSGKTYLEGNANRFDFEISGSGDYRAFNLNALRGDIEIRGSGDAEVRVEEELDVEIRGSGDVFYRGFPVLDVQILGSGQVINAN